MIPFRTTPPLAMRRAAAVLAGTMLLPGVRAADAQAAPARASVSRAAIVRVVDSLLADAVSNNRLASVSAAVVRGNDTLVLRAVGEAHRESKREATPETVYRLGSITKQFTASIVLQLVAEGKLALDDSVGRFLPWLPATWRPIPLAQLLNHTSGIPSYTNLGPVWSVRAHLDMTPDTLIGLTVGRPLDFAPGTSWRYNNTGYVTLGAIIERIEGKSYAEVVAARIARPLGLTSLRYCPTDPDSSRDAFPYDNAAKRTFRPAARLSLTQPHAAGALCSTARDLVKWNVALHGGKVLRPDLYQRMTTPEGSARATNYGFGIGRDTSGGVVRLSHGGGINGFVTTNSYTPSTGLSIVVLANTASGETDRLAAQIARAVAGTPLVQRATVIPIAPAELAAYIGRYELTLPGRTLPFSVEAGNSALLMRFGADTTSARMVPIARHRFMDENDENTVFDFILDGGRVTGVVLDQGQRFNGRKLP